MRFTRESIFCFSLIVCAISIEGIRQENSLAFVIEFVILKMLGSSRLVAKHKSYVDILGSTPGITARIISC